MTLTDLAARPELCFMVRHADAGDRGGWSGDDARRPLSGRGRHQAGALAGHLAPHGIDRVGRVFSSPALRCVETVSSLATTLGVAVEVVEALAEGTPHATVQSFLRTACTQNSVVVCSHGDVIGDVLTRLDAAGVQLTGAPALGKAGTWVLDTVGGDVRAGRYVRPPG